MKIMLSTMLSTLLKTKVLAGGKVVSRTTLIVVLMITASGCSHQMPTSITTATSPTAPGIRGTVPAYGSDCQYHLFGMVPLNGPSDTQAALTEAKASANADVLTDVTVDHGGGFYGLFSNRCVRVAGLGVVRGSSLRNIELADEGWSDQERDWNGGGAAVEPESQADEGLGFQDEQTGAQPYDGYGERRDESPLDHESRARFGRKQIRPIPEDTRIEPVVERELETVDGAPEVVNVPALVTVEEPSTGQQHTESQNGIELDSAVATNSAVTGVIGTSESAAVEVIPSVDTSVEDAGVPGSQGESLTNETSGGSGIGDAPVGDGAFADSDNELRQHSGIGDNGNAVGSEGLSN
jgi:hypothetical protein